MATYLADRVIVFEGQPSFKTFATAPQSLLTGINIFLKALNVTFRRDRSNFRPRINKLNGARVIEIFFFNLMKNSLIELILGYRAKEDWSFFLFRVRLLELF